MQSLVLFKKGDFNAISTFIDKIDLSKLNHFDPRKHRYYGLAKVIAEIKTSIEELKLMLITFEMSKGRKIKIKIRK